MDTREQIMEEKIPNRKVVANPDEGINAHSNSCQNTITGNIDC
ncbi:MAG: hypothetical protein ABEJ83_01350 [Candidatus Nanohaloarchaea archaeon]